MSGRIKSNDATTEALCPTCGLCCNGVIFANLALQPGDEAGRLRALGLPVCSSHSALRPPHLAQPCGAFDGCRCRVYADRPHYCREFECALLQSVKAGRTDHGAAARIIRTARERAEKVRRLLHALGDTDEQLPLSARFRRTGKRLKEHELSEDDAEAYGQLTLAVHDLNLLLSEAFYPGSTRHRSRSVGAVAVSVVAATVLLLLAAAGSVLGDQVELQNGDRYVGEVLSLNAKTVVLQSEVLGTLRLPRNKVAVITLGPVRPANSPALPSPTNSDAAASAAPPARTASNATPALPGRSLSTNLIQQVQKQFLSGAGPEANAKFNELLGGFLSGKLSMEDIRGEAKSAANQLRALQRESGEDSGIAAKAYLDILDRFLKETAPSGTPTNAPATSPGTKAAPAEKDE